MNTLAEIEAAASTLPPKQLRKLQAFISVKLAGAQTKPELSAHDLMKDGCGIVKSGKRDLATNKKYMSGYGR